MKKRAARAIKRSCLRPDLAFKTIDTAPPGIYGKRFMRTAFKWCSTVARLRESGVLAAMSPLEHDTPRKLRASSSRSNSGMELTSTASSNGETAEKGTEKTRRAVVMFNSGDADGALVSLGYTDSTKLNVDWMKTAEFLRNTPGLDKGVIGTLLAKQGHRALLDAYIDGLKMSGKTLDKALRLMLSGFELPGEIERIMEAFATSWSSANHGDSSLHLQADTAFILSVAIIMLNTDLHNANVKKKMTKEEFTKNVTLATGGGGKEAVVPVATLHRIYKSIKREEIKPSEGGGLGESFW